MFQSYAFQTNAFQVAGSANDNLLGGKDYSYVSAPQRHRLEEHQRKLIAEERNKLEQLNKELAKAEARKLKLAKLEAEEIAAEKLAALEASLLAQIDRLRLERALLIQRIRNEEAILVLLMALKRRRLRAG